MIVKLIRSPPDKEDIEKIFPGLKIQIPEEETQFKLTLPIRIWTNTLKRYSVTNNFPFEGFSANIYSESSEIIL